MDFYLTTSASSFSCFWAMLSTCRQSCLVLGGLLEQLDFLGLFIEVDCKEIIELWKYILGISFSHDDSL
jgi:hypothetical protein